jgi:Transport and Golgi organisation 2
MCTVSWVHAADGYHLLCNRDEKRTRSAALPPCVERFDGVKVIAPRDGDFGGSWIAVNELGVAVCLLNGTPRPAPESRGHLLLGLSSVRSALEARERIVRMELGAYAPFTLVAIEPGKPVVVMDWDETKRFTTDSPGPLISSSFDPAGVRAARQCEFARLVAGGITPHSLYSFHESHGSEAGPYSPCMHRVDAETVSFSWVTVTRRGVSFFYGPGSPCRLGPGGTTHCSRN